MEASYFYKINTNALALKKLKNEIKKIRDKIDKRYHRRNKRIQILAEQLDVKKDLIKRWISAGWIDLNDPKKTKIIVRMIIERDYAKMLKLHKIPTDSEEDLWDRY